MTPSEKAIKQFQERDHLPFVSPCGCMGPKGDDPLCSCKMKWTEVVDGNIYYIDWVKGGWSATLVGKR